MIPKVSGTVSGMDFFKKNGTWNGAGYMPSKGDIIYFRSGSSNSGYHVGIVSDVANGTIYTIEGNSSDKVSTHSYSVSSSKIAGYGCPNYYRPNPEPPTDFNISTDKSSYAAGETVTFSFTSNNSTELYIPIDVNGVRKHFIDVTGKSTYSCSFDEAGIYSYCLYGKNAYGECGTKYVIFNIYDSSPMNIGDSFYAKIKNQDSNLYFTNTGSTIRGKTASDSDNQIWKFERQTDNSYKIISQSDGLPMDVLGAETADGTDIRTWTDNGLLAQRYYI